MRVVAICSVLAVLLIEAYFVVAQHLTGPFHVAAMILSLVAFAALIFP